MAVAATDRYLMPGVLGLLYAAALADTFWGFSVYSSDRQCALNPGYEAEIKKFLLFSGITEIRKKVSLSDWYWLNLGLCPAACCAAKFCSMKFIMSLPSGFVLRSASRMFIQPPAGKAVCLLYDKQLAAGQTHINSFSTSWEEILFPFSVTP